MTRSTKCKLKSVKHTSRTTIATIELRIPRYTKDNPEYELRELKNNLKWLGPHLASWRGWDSGYTVEILIDGLRELGNRMLKYNNHTNTIKKARRALFAAHRLSRVRCQIEWTMRDRSSENQHRRLCHENIPMNGGYVRWKPIYLETNAMNLSPEDYYNKMSKVIQKRVQKEFNEEYKSTWAYIAKYIQYWWD